MELRTGRFGKFFGCTSADCKNTRKLLRNGQAAPPKADPVPMPELRCEKVDDYFVLRDGAAGIFLAASGFPRNRETRAPLVEELLPHKDAIDPKYQFLLLAPTSDPDATYDVVKGDLATLHGTGGDFSISVLECLSTENILPFASDAQDPDPKTETGRCDPSRQPVNVDRSIRAATSYSRVNLAAQRRPGARRFWLLP